MPEPDTHTAATSVECDLGQCDDCTDMTCTCHCHLPDADDQEWAA